MAEDKQSLSENKTFGQAGAVGFVHPAADTLLVQLSGSWMIGQQVPSADAVLSRLQSGKGIRRIAFETGGLTGWDSSLLTFLTDIYTYCSANEIVLEKDGLPAGIQKLMALAGAVAERKGARKQTIRAPILERIGTVAIGFWQAASELLGFIGAAVVALLKFAAGRASFRRGDLMLFIQQCGIDALPIVTLISFLVGLIQYVNQTRAALIRGRAERGTK
jgi:phospholipid/cholesterol/gamma-HCH transport system permease protein